MTQRTTLLMRRKNRRTIRNILMLREVFNPTRDGAGVFYDGRVGGKRKTAGEVLSTPVPCRVKRGQNDQQTQLLYGTNLEVKTLSIVSRFSFVNISVRGP